MSEVPDNIAALPPACVAVWMYAGGVLRIDKCRAHASRLNISEATYRRAFRKLKTLGYLSGTPNLPVNPRANPVKRGQRRSTRA